MKQNDEELKKYLSHLRTCNIMRDWSASDNAMGETPNKFRDNNWQMAYDDLQTKKNTCTCGLDKILTPPTSPKEEMLFVNKVLNVLRTYEKTAHRNVGKGCNYETYILPDDYILIAKELSKEYTPAPAEEWTESEKDLIDKIAFLTKENENLKAASSKSEELSEADLDKIIQNTPIIKQWMEFGVDTAESSDMKKIAKHFYRLHVSNYKEFVSANDTVTIRFHDQNKVEELKEENERLKESCKELNGVIDEWKNDFKGKDQRIKELEEAMKEIEEIVPSALGMFQARDIVRKLIYPSNNP